MAKNNYIKSPMNYTGGKHKLLPQIIPLFPDNINTFVDLFTGGCNVAANVKAKRVIANDRLSPIIDVYRRFQNFDVDVLVEEVEKRVSERGLSMTNREAFLQLREEYNKTDERDPLDLFLLMCHAFNHQVRFNGKGEYNMPFGKDRSEWNPSIRKNLIAFRQAITDIVFTDKDFRELKVDKLGPNDLVYCDPPYLITCATYNERNGWDETCENDLLNLLDRLDANGIRFAFSNVLTSKGKTNDLLIDWSSKYNVAHLSNTYSNCNYHTKDRESVTDEVLITNYLNHEDNLS